MYQLSYVLEVNSMLRDLERIFLPAVVLHTFLAIWVFCLLLYSVKVLPMLRIYKLFIFFRILIALIRSDLLSIIGLHTVFTSFNGTE